MTPLLLAEAALRALLLGAGVALALRLLRVRQPATEILSLQALLAGAWLMPLLMRWTWFRLPALPEMSPLPITPSGHLLAPVARLLETSATRGGTGSALPALVDAAPAAAPAWARLDPATGLTLLWAGVAAFLLLRLLLGLAMAARLARAARPLGRPGGFPLRQSAALDLPVTIGGTILVPEAWDDWDEARRRAILLHEGEHVRQGDFWWQLVAGAYRALFWFNPLGWWLAARLRDLAERRSDDRVLADTFDRADYAGLLLEFGARRSRLSPGVAMARPGSLVRRIERILEGEETMIGITWKKRIAVLAGLAVAVALCAGGASVARDRAAGGAVGSGEAVWRREATEDHATTSGSGFAYHFSSDPADEPYVYVHGTSVTMSGDTDDIRRARAFQERIQGDYIWFTREGQAFVVTDQRILERFNALFAPQEALSAQQERLSQWQERLSEWQERVSQAMERVSQALGEHPGSGQYADSMSALAEQQSEIGRLQSEVGNEQSKLGEQQSRFAADSTERVRALLDEARGQGLALPAS